MGYSKREFGKMLEQMNPHLADEIHWAEQEYLHGIQSDVKRVQVKMSEKEIVNIVEKEGSMQLISPLSTEIKYALEGRGYEVTNTKVNLK